MKTRIADTALLVDYDDKSGTCFPDGMNTGKGYCPKHKKRRFGRKKVAFQRKRRSSIETLDSYARKYDVDGDGVLDDVEIAMMKRDKEGRGHLTNEDIYNIVADQLNAKHDVNNLRKAIAGLVCFVFILALSNLGTSMASAILSKETHADQDSGTLTIISTGETLGVQSAGETIEIAPLPYDVRRSRRNLVLEELEGDRQGRHAHRLLSKKKSGSSCKKSDTTCTGKIIFDSGKISQKDAETIKSKCDGSKTLNMKRVFEDGTSDSNVLCKPGSSVIEKKGKNKRSNVRKSRGEDRKNIMITTEGKSTNFACNGSDCFVSGTSLLQSIGEPCDVLHGDDDCEEGLVCEVEDRSDVTGVCLSRSDLGKPWYVSSEAQICVQDCEVGPNCGGRAQDYNELFATPELCCGTMLSYMNFRVCIPDWNAL